jgi:hypothetical protein
MRNPLFYEGSNRKINEFRGSVWNPLFSIRICVLLRHFCWVVVAVNAPGWTSLWLAERLAAHRSRNFCSVPTWWRVQKARITSSYPQGGDREFVSALNNCTVRIRFRIFFSCSSESLSLSFSLSLSISLCFRLLSSCASNDPLLHVCHLSHI